MSSTPKQDLETEKSVQELEYAKEDAEAQSQAGPKVDQLAEAILIRKQDIRIIPLSAAIYLLCYLDRSNIGNAKILNSETHNDLLDETHMTNLQYTIALMVFLIAYATFEVPANMMLKRFSPSRWIAFLMFSWGALTMGLGGTKSYGSVTAVRFLLGAFEAGLFPGLIYYLTFWYRTEERSVRAAFILASATLAGAFGGAIAYGVGHMNRTGGLSAWRWLFILEGLPSCLSSILVFFLLPDYPETARWLNEDEKRLAELRLRGQASQGSSRSASWVDVKECLTTWRLYAHYALYFGVSPPFSSLSLFTPSIVAGLGFTSLRANLMTVPPYAIAYVFTIFISWSADRTNTRGLHTAAAALIGAIGFIGSAALPPTAYWHRYGCLIIGASGSFASIPPLLGWISSNVFSTTTVGLAIALNVSFGAPGQIVGVWIYKADEAKRGYPTGHWTNAALLLFTSVGCLLLLVYYRRKNRALLSQGGEQRLYKL
ncbi:MFS transporter [Mycena metata]|uniref:MFS transporter n=1 Tax=Mycena metata TaxID=1033252 RepID=A0AAD7IW05_9AGAR|nr:MFS transporter [Mycena metata]